MSDEDPYIRKSPATLTIKIVLAEAITEFLYSLLHYALYNVGEPYVTNIGRVSALLNIAMSFVAVIMFIVITATWAAEGVLIKKDELVYKYGVINGHHKSYPFANMQRIEVQQGIVGRMFNFGTITVHLPILEQDVRFSDMPSPHDFADRLRDYIIKPSRQQYLIKR